MKNIFTKIIIGLGFALSISTSAIAVDNNGPIDAAIKAGKIGEQENGYLGFVRPATAAQIELQRLINEVNVRRRAVYTRVATETNDTIERVAKLQGYRQISKSANGEFYKDTAGVWCEKAANSRVSLGDDGTITVLCPAPIVRN